VRISDFFPIAKLIPTYSRSDFRADALAGLTTAVLLIPQGMAYAMLAGLPPIIGLYAALIPPLVYAFLGTSRQLSVGPVAMDSLLVAAGVGALATSNAEDYVAAAVLLGLMVGAMQVLMGLLRMGFLVNFVSHPVMSGFTSAAALMIGLSQAKHLLGIEVEGSPNFFVLLSRVAETAPSADLTTLALGAIAVLVLAALKKWAPKAPGALVVVVLATLIVPALGWQENVAVVGEVPPGLPTARLPVVSWSLFSALLPTAATIALVAFMESISVSQSYATKNKYSISADKEFVALGLANVVGSLFRGYPVTGGFSRTAVNATAGARTQLAGIITSALVFLALVFLTPLFHFLPKAALAAIIMMAVYGLIDFAEVKHLHKVKRADLALLLVTFASTLALGIVRGMGVGVVASLLWFVFRTTRPHIAVLGRIPGTTQFRNVARQRGLITYEGVLILRMDAQFYFGNVSFLRETLQRLEIELPEALVSIVLDASAMNNLDSSAEAALDEMRAEYEARQVEFFLTGVKGPVLDVLSDSGLKEKLGIRCACRTVHDALTHLGATPRATTRPSTAPESRAGEKASRASAKL